MTVAINLSCPSCFHRKCYSCLVEQVAIRSLEYVSRRSSFRQKKAEPPKFLQPGSTSHRARATGGVGMGGPDLLQDSALYLEMRDGGSSSSSAGVATPSTDDSVNSEWEDSWGIETHEIGDDLPTLAVANQLSEVTRDILNRLFSRYHLWRQAAAGPSEPQSESTSRSHEDRQSPSAGQSRKRPHSPDDDGQRDDTPVDETDSGPRRVEATTLRLLFACPFWKSHSNHWRDCFKYKLKRIRDVKQHLRRIHAACCYCVRCGQDFHRREDLDTHYGSIPSCDARQFQRKWLSEVQKESLAKRSDPRCTDEEQWFAIWDIVFPGELRPDSPYLDGDLSEDLNSFREFFMTQGPMIIQEMEEIQGIHGTVHERYLLQMGLGRIYNQWASRRGHVPLQRVLSSDNSSVVRNSSGPSPFDFNASVLEVSPRLFGETLLYEEEVQLPETSDPDPPDGNDLSDFDVINFDPMFFDAGATTVSPADLEIDSEPAPKMTRRSESP